MSQQSIKSKLAFRNLVKNLWKLPDIVINEILFTSYLYEVQWVHIKNHFFMPMLSFWPSYDIHKASIEALPKQFRNVLVIKSF